MIKAIVCFSVIFYKPQWTVHCYPLHSNLFLINFIFQPLTHCSSFCILPCCNFRTFGSFQSCNCDIRTVFLLFHTCEVSISKFDLQTGYPEWDYSSFSPAPGGKYRINFLKTNRRLLYLKAQSVPRCKHSSSQL